MTERIEVNDGEWMDVNENLYKAAIKHAAENNLRVGEAFASYLTQELSDDSESDDENDDE